MAKSGHRYNTPEEAAQRAAEFEALLRQGAPRKRSVNVAGHRTSVSLEQPFWNLLGDAAAERGMSLNALIAEIDAQRARSHSGLGLSGALRIYVLARLRG